MSIYQYNGKQYGVPWDMGMIGFWYNKALFEKAGITAPPTTWDEYLAAIGKLKDAGITPLAIAGKDQWPSMHLWTYLVLRNGGAEALQQMVADRRLEPGRLHQGGRGRRGAQRARAVPGRLPGRDYNQEAASVGNGKAAMELMGQWAPSVQRDQSADKKGLGDDLGWFAFPAVTGGAGAPTDGVGGGNGIAVGKDAPPEAVDFLKFFNDVDEPATSSTPTASASRRPSGPRPRSPTRTSRPSSTAVVRRSSSSCTSTRRRRPSSARSSTRPRWRCSPVQSDPADRLPDHHRRGCRAVTSAYGTDRSDRQRERAGPAGPLDSTAPEGDG